MNQFIFYSMKRIYSLLFVTIAMLMLSVSSAWAQYVKLTAEDGTESWIEIEGTINGTNIEIYKVFYGEWGDEDYSVVIDNNTMGSIDLNEVWSESGGRGTHYQVTSIGYSAFDGCAGLTSIVIPSSVTIIESSAFSGCSGLTSIVIPSNVTSIGWDAFSGCSGLTSIDIPSSVTSIGWGAFSGCRGLTSIDIPSSVTSIGDGAFSGCSGLTSLIIPSSVTSIESSAFSGCSGLTSIVVESGNSVYDSRNNCNAIIKKASNTLIVGCKNTKIPSSVTSIENSAFSGCSGLTSVVIPSSVTSIGDNAFSGCSDLTSIDISSGLTNIGRSVFYGCSGLTSVVLPSSVTSIGDNAFYGCSGLASIDISSGLTNIGRNAFYGCSALTTVVIPSSMTSIGSYAFSHCTGLISVDIPSSVTSIGEDAFWSCTGLTSVVLPSSVTSIGGNAFSGCDDLTSIVVESSNPVYDSRNNCNAIIETASNTLIAGCKNTMIPSNVTSIGVVAFNGCSGLTSIDIPSSVTSIGQNAFNGCSGLTSIDIPSSVVIIGPYAFRGCIGLTSVTSYITKVFGTGTGAFSGCNNATLYVPNGLVNTYRSTADWNRFNKIRETPDLSLAKYVKLISENGMVSWIVIDGITNGTFIEIGNHKGYSAIDEKTNGCIDLNEVWSESGGSGTHYQVTSIGDNAFDGCIGLTSIEIPSSVTSIGSSAFSGCSGLNKVIVKDITAWCNISFSDNPLSYAHHLYSDENTEITNLIIPSGVTNIGSSAFSGCSNLTSVTSYITDIFETGKDAFTGCENATLYVPKGLANFYRITTDWNRFKKIEEMQEVTPGTIVVSCNNKGKVKINGTTEFTNNVGEVSVIDGIDNTFVFQPNDNCELRQVLIDGLDVTLSVESNQLTTKVHEGSKMIVMFDKKGADVNGDGQLNISDVVALVNLILGQ